MVANLVYPSRSVEKVLFAERFENPAKVHQNGGVLTGSPVIDADGIHLDGTQGVDYTNAANALDSFLSEGGSIRCVIEADSVISNAKRFFSYTSGNFSVTLAQHSTGLTVYAQVRYGAGDSYYVPAAVALTGRVSMILTWDPATTTAKLYLNGTLEATDNVAGTLVLGEETTQRTVRLGISSGNDWIGRIEFGDVYGRVLEQGDVDAIESGSLWSYMNRCNLHLAMETQTQRPDRDSELIIDGDQEAPTTAAYTTSGVGVLTKSSDSPYKGLQAIRCTAAGAGDAAVRQNSIVDVAFRYLVTGVGRGTTAGLQLTDPFTQDLIPALTTDWQSFYAIVVAGGPGGEHLVIANIAAMAGGEWFEIDELSVQPMLDQTLDSSRFGHLCTVGNGHGGWPPEFTNPGFEFVNDFLLVPRAESIFNHPFQSLALAFSPNVAANFDGTFFLYDSLNGLTRYALYHNNLLGGSELEVMMADLGIHIPLAAYGHLWRVNGPNVIVVSCAHRDTDVMFNGVLIVDSHNHEFTPVVQTEIVLGSYRGKNSSWFMGGQRGFRSWPEKLCRLQMLDVTADMGVVV